jgi:hypothetical protein
MDLGRNTQSILDEEMLNLEFDVKPNQDAAQQEVLATQEALLQNKNFDPTVDLEAPAAGSATAAGAGEDDGFDIVQIEYAEPRMTPVNGFETTGIGVVFIETLPELILEPQPVQAAVGALGGGIVETLKLLEPVASIFTLNEGLVEEGPDLIDGDSSKLLGFRVEPSLEDSVTSISIKGFPENSNPDESDWLIAQDAKIIDQDANYQVDFVGEPILSSNDTWDVTIEVTGALPGEEVSFAFSVIPLENVAENVPISLEIETTVDNSSGEFTSSVFENVGISFIEQSQELFASTSSAGFSEDTVAAAVLPINSFVSQDLDVPPVDVL